MGAAHEDRVVKACEELTEILRLFDALWPIDEVGLRVTDFPMVVKLRDRLKNHFFDLFCKSSADLGKFGMRYKLHLDPWPTLANKPLEDGMKLVNEAGDAPHCLALVCKKTRTHPIEIIPSLLDGRDILLFRHVCNISQAIAQGGGVDKGESSSAVFDAIKLAYKDMCNTGMTQWSACLGAHEGKFVKRVVVVAEKLGSALGEAMTEARKVSDQVAISVTSLLATETPIEGKSVTSLLEKEIVADLRSATTKLRSAARSAKQYHSWVAGDVTPMVEGHNVSEAAKMKGMVAAFDVYVSKLDEEDGKSVGETLGNCTALQLLFCIEGDKATLASRLVATAANPQVVDAAPMTVHSKLLAMLQKASSA